MKKFNISFSPKGIALLLLVTLLISGTIYFGWYGSQKLTAKLEESSSSKG